MTDPVYPADPSFIAAARIGSEDYARLYAESVSDPDGFWGRQASRLQWMKPPTRIRNVSFRREDFRIRWFEDGELNVAVNCLDRHLATRGDKTALIWQGDDPARSQRISYRELHAEVGKLANALRRLGVAKGDRVTLYLPMIPQAAVAMLACARIGAIHSVVFGGFAAKELATRIDDAKPKLILTASCGIEPGRIVEYKPLLDAAIDLARSKPEAVILFQRPQAKAAMKDGRDRDWAGLREAAMKAGKSADYYQECDDPQSTFHRVFE